jgi:hypothetical protein
LVPSNLPAQPLLPASGGGSSPLGLDHQSV